MRRLPRLLKGHVLRLFKAQSEKPLMTVVGNFMYEVIEASLTHALLIKTNNRQWHRNTESHSTPQYSTENTAYN